VGEDVVDGEQAGMGEDADEVGLVVDVGGALRVHGASALAA
jgi:hypothetical protein